jgi:hypothetical protein
MGGNSIALAIEKRDEEEMLVVGVSGEMVDGEGLASVRRTVDGSGRGSRKGGDEWKLAERDCRVASGVVRGLKCA